jgi:hypothetical protein
MKKTFIYSLLVILISCNHTRNDKIVTSFNEHTSKQESKTTSTVSSYNSGSELKLTYTSSQNTDDGICNFNGYCSLKIKPATEINMGFHFEKSGAQIKDTLNTQLFSKFMDLNNVKKIQIDSLTYKVIDKEIKLKFIVSLIRDENDKLKIVDKYSMVYSSGFKNPKPKMILDKIEKSSIEIIGNTY